MSTQIMVSLLRKGQTGDQILEILDSIADGMDSSSPDVPVAKVAQDA